MERKPLSESIGDVADVFERQAIAEGYADASRFVRPLMRDLPDGHVAVGAMDGFVTIIPMADMEITDSAGVDRTFAAWGY